MLLTLDTFEQFKPGEIMRIVTTKLQNIHQPMIGTLTFVALKDDSGHFWAIYCHWSYNSIDFICTSGDKVFSETEIRHIMPCDDEMFKRYRL